MAVMEEGEKPKKEEEDFFLRGLNPEFVERKEQEMVNWNAKFPIDLWWRKKYKVAFGSKEHLRASIPNQLHDYLEDKLINGKKPVKETEVYDDELVEVDDNGKIHIHKNDKVVQTSDEDIDSYYNDMDEEIEEDDTDQ